MPAWGRRIWTLQVDVGDIVEVTGKRTTVVQGDAGSSRAARTVPDSARWNRRARMPGAGLDESVQVRKALCRPAEQVVLAPINITPSERDLDYIGSLLDGLAVLEGNRIRATLFGSRWADFKVESTAPKGPVF